MVQHTKKVHKTVKKHLSTNYNNYIEATENERKKTTFEVGDLVMIYLQKERFSYNIYNKLMEKKYEPHSKSYKRLMPMPVSFIYQRK